MIAGGLRPGFQFGIPNFVWKSWPCSRAGCAQLGICGKPAGILQGFRYPGSGASTAHNASRAVLRFFAAECTKANKLAIQGSYRNFIRGRSRIYEGNAESSSGR